MFWFCTSAGLVGASLDTVSVSVVLIMVPRLECKEPCSVWLVSVSLLIRCGLSPKLMTVPLRTASRSPMVITVPRRPAFDGSISRYNLSWSAFMLHTMDIFLRASYGSLDASVTSTTVLFSFLIHGGGRKRRLIAGMLRSIPPRRSSAPFSPYSNSTNSSIFGKTNDAMVAPARFKPRAKPLRLSKYSLMQTMVQLKSIPWPVPDISPRENTRNVIPVANTDTMHPIDIISPPKMATLRIPNE
uniref:Putative secreted protein n=1 Tax=Ixodes ricinus TaxID=34613 RepID=A0A6B0V446_IXORI